MPEEFDPAWEYWEPDPEIAEVLREYAQRGKDDFGGIDFARKTDFVSGMRFGKGDPNRFWGRLALPKHTARDYTKPTEYRQCKGCGCWFSPDKHCRLYCKRACVPHQGRARELPDIACQFCGKVFRPRDYRRRFCSLKCGSSLGAANAALVHTKDFDSNQFRILWLEGATIQQIRDHFSASRKWVDSARKKLGLPARKVRKCSSMTV